MEPHQEKKLDDILGAVNQLIPQVKDAKDEVHSLRHEVNGIKIQNARQDERITNICGDVDNLGGKVRDHVGAKAIHRSEDSSFQDATVRWGFIAKVTAGLGGMIALIALISGYLK